MLKDIIAGIVGISAIVLVVFILYLIAVGMGIKP